MQTGEHDGKQTYAHSEFNYEYELWILMEMEIGNGDG